MTCPDRRTEAFFALLRSGLWERPLRGTEAEAVAALAPDDWFALDRLARKQSVPGLIYQALTLLPAGTAVPGDVVLDLMARAEEIRLENQHKAAVTALLTERFAQQGISPRVMKGASVAVYYSRPELRESGDIDLYVVPEAFEQAKACLTAPYRASDGSFHSKEDGVDIDLHDRYFDLHCADSRLPQPGTPEATLLMLSAHILKHAIGVGVGLRQCCDLAAAYRCLEADLEPEALKDCFRRTGTLRWNRLLFSFLAEWLDVDEKMFAGERVSGDPLLRIILEGGNFGHYADARLDGLAAGGRHRKRDTFRRFVRRLPFSLRYAPRETSATIFTLLRGNLRRG